MPGSTQFEALLNRYFQIALRELPMMATYAGLTSGEGRLGRTGLAFETKQQKQRSNALQRLERISPRELSSEQQIDRLAFRSRLLHEIEDFERGRHTLDPNAPDQLLNILLHELQRGDREPVRAARNIRSLLREAPSFLKEAAAMIDRPEPVWLKIMVQTVESSPALFQAVAGFLKDGTDLQDKDQTLIDTAQDAVQRYASDVRKKPLAKSGSFAIGPIALARRVRDELGLDYSLEQIEALAKAEIERINALLLKACRKISPRQSGAELIEKERKAWNPQHDLLELYRRETKRMAKGFRKSRAVTFPRGDELEVRPVPEFMRHLFPTAAYSSPGAFAKEQRGVFWVNDLSVTKQNETDRRAERQQHFGLALTCAHEAYPGHHLQFVLSNQHPRKWRRLFAHAVFYEGWTLWCEQMTIDLKLERGPIALVIQLHDALWRCHRILVDLRLQTRRYSYEQAVRHMQRHLGFTRARAEADVNWYTASPGVPMSYWLGRLENERLYQKLVEGRGWSLRRFNDWLLGFGTVPQAWIEKYGLD